MKKEVNTKNKSEIERETIYVSDCGKGEIDQVWRSDGSIRFTTYEDASGSYKHFKNLEEAKAWLKANGCDVS